MVGILVLLSACSSQSNATSTPTASPKASPSASATNGALRRSGTDAAQWEYLRQLRHSPGLRAGWAALLGGALGNRQGVAGWGARTFATVKTVTTERGGGYSERGLLGLAISPTFSQDRFVYAFYSDTNYTEQHVIRWRDCGGTGTDAKIVVTVPAGGDCCHKGGRIAFGTDGMLYVTLGDEHSASAAQNTSDLRGKVLRYRPDGSTPSDNPFGASNPVWAYGIRNPFGIAVSSSGQIAVTSNGPSGDAGAPSTGYDSSS